MHRRKNYCGSLRKPRPYYSLLNPHKFGTITGQQSKEEATSSARNTTQKKYTYGLTILPAMTDSHDVHAPCSVVDGSVRSSPSKRRFRDSVTTSKRYFANQTATTGIRATYLLYSRELSPSRRCIGPDENKVKILAPHLAPNLHGVQKHCTSTILM